MLCQGFHWLICVACSRKHQSQSRKLVFVSHICICVLSSNMLKCFKKADVNPLLASCMGFDGCDVPSACFDDSTPYVL